MVFAGIGFAFGRKEACSEAFRPLYVQLESVVLSRR